MSTLIRRIRNRIEQLKDDKGYWIEDVNGFKTLAVQFFGGYSLKFFLLLLVFSFQICFHMWIFDSLNVVGKSVELIEVRDSLFNNCGLTTPDVDGFPVFFYQCNWQVCASDIFHLVSQDFQDFQDCSIPLKLNATLITLVPKVVNP